MINEKSMAVIIKMQEQDWRHGSSGGAPTLQT
jgi:hypothetical protein